MAAALYGTPVGLFSKLKYIWDFTVRLIFLAEKKHLTEIKNNWGLHAKKALNSDSLIQKSNLAAKHGLKNLYHDDDISTAYFSALNEIRKINFNFHCIEDGKHVASGKLFIIEADDKEFIQKILTSEYNKCQDFLDYVVPHFFPLQLYCLKLTPVINSAPGIPVDPAKRRQRAITAASASKYGEERLKSDILTFLKKQKPKTKYKSISNLFDSLYEDFSIILAEYKKNIGSTSEESGIKISYGSLLKTPSLERKLRGWKKDAEFKRQLEKICIIKPS